MEEELNLEKIKKAIDILIEEGAFQKLPNTYQGLLNQRPYPFIEPKIVDMPMRIGLRAAWATGVDKAIDVDQTILFGVPATLFGVPDTNEAYPIEYDNGGNILAYKYLDRITVYQDEPLVVQLGGRRGFATLYPEGGVIQYYASLTFYGLWLDRFLRADVCPREDNHNGIYCARHPSSSRLFQYRPGIYDQEESYAAGVERAYGTWRKERVLVQLLLAGTVIVGEQGYRAEEAYILHELND